MTREQKRIIYLGALTLAFIFLFWFLVYAPQGRRFASIKRRLAEVEGQIARIQSIAEGGDLAGAISGLRLRLTKISKILPKEETAAIYSLSEAARKLNIQVKNIAPSAKLLIEDKIAGSDLEELPISIVLVSDYRALGEYLSILRNNVPVLIRFNQLDIQGKGEGHAGLDATLQVSAYLLREK